MLRMGRSPRNEQTEKQQAPQPSIQPAAPQFQSTAQTPGLQTPRSAEPPAQVQQRPVAPAPSATPATPRALSESDALARDIREGIMSGFVGGGTTLTGEADFKGMLRIDGHLTGRVTSEKGTLIVSAGGRVDADIEVAAAKVNGVVNGDIVATERIEFGRNAQVRGNIQTPALVIEQGAIFEGSCRMTQAKSAAEKAQQASTEARRAETPRPAQTRPREEKRATAEAGDTIPVAPAAVLDAGASAGMDSAAVVSKAAG